MNKHILMVGTLAAMSVSGAAHADYKAKVSAYGSVRVMIEDNDVKENISGEDALSRFGIKASQKISSDLTAFGQIEFGVDADDNGVNAAEDTDRDIFRRLGRAGLKGSWGSISFGAQTQVWHKFVRGAKFSDGVDTLRLGTIRDQDSLQYFGKFGGVKVGLSRSFEGNDNEHTQLGAAIPFPHGKLGVAYTLDEEGGLLGLRPEVRFGGTLVSLLYYNADSDFTAHGANLCKDGGDTVSQGLYAKQKLGSSFTLHGRYMELDCDDDAKDADSTKVELIKQFNKKARIWFAYETGEGGNVKDKEAQIGIRFDF